MKGIARPRVATAAGVPAVVALVAAVLLVIPRHRASANAGTTKYAVPPTVCGGESSTCGYASRSATVTVPLTIR